ncbi:MAG: TetR/AcrR family transcriptional regulator [Bdellovibrionota bacterium]
MANATAKASTKREMDKEARRQSILDAAKKIFADKGFHETSVSDIVREAGIAQGTFYLYFEDKKAVFGEIVDDLMNTLIGFFTIRDISRIQSTQDMEAVVRRISGPLITFFQENRDLGKIFIREAMGTGLGLEKKILAFYDRVIQLGTTYFEHFRKEGHIRKDIDARVGMNFLIGGAQMIIYRWVTEGIDVSEAEIVHSVANLCLSLFQD